MASPHKMAPGHKMMPGHKPALETASNETPAQWITLARRVHGGFGSYLPLGIRIGQDARRRLGQGGRSAGMRDLDVTYFDGANAPCPCVIDGLMLSTGATVGQGSLRLSPLKSAPGTFGIADIQHKVTGQRLRYVIPASARVPLDKWNQTQSERGRYDAVMRAPQAQMFEVENLLSLKGGKPVIKK